jgi:hypothetical protein
MAKKQVVKQSVFRRGNITQRSETDRVSPFLSIKENGRVDVIVAAEPEGMIHFPQHSIWLQQGNSPQFPCIRGTGQVCPGCQYNDLQAKNGEKADKPKLKVYLPVYLIERDPQSGKDTGQLTPKIYSFGNQVAAQIGAITDAMQSIQGMRLRITRAGSGLNTKWTIVQMGPYAGQMPAEDFPIDYEALVSPTDREGILSMMATSGLDLTNIATEAELRSLGFAAGDEEDEEDDVPFETEEDGSGWEKA